MTLESPILNLAEFLGKEVIILLRNGPTQAGVIIPSSIELLPWGWMTGLYPYSIDSAPALTWTGTGRWDIIDEHEYDIMKIDLKN
jgi:hypothetical protein